MWVKKLVAKRLCAALAVSGLVLIGVVATADGAFPGASGKILFHTTRDGNFEIYAMAATGADQTRITNNPADDSFAVWSPDGWRIAFHSNRDGNYEIYVMNADGSEQTRLTAAAGNDQFPAWSPNGRQIAFTSERDGNAEIYVMNADGSEQNLTLNAADDRAPAWSPNGKQIAFVSQRDGNFERHHRTDRWCAGFRRWLAGLSLRTLARLARAGRACPEAATGFVTCHKPSRCSQPPEDAFDGLCDHVPVARGSFAMLN